MKTLEINKMESLHGGEVTCGESFGYSIGAAVGLGILAGVTGGVGLAVVSIGIFAFGGGASISCLRDEITNN